MTAFNPFDIPPPNADDPGARILRLHRGTQLADAGQREGGEPPRLSPANVVPIRPTTIERRGAVRPIPAEELHRLFGRRDLRPTRHVVIERSPYAGVIIAASALVSWAVMLGCVWLIVSGTL